MSRNDPPLRIRLPEDVFWAVRNSAASNHRSLNGEIVGVLQAHYAAARTLEERVAVLEDKLALMDYQARRKNDD